MSGTGRGLPSWAPARTALALGAVGAVVGAGGVTGSVGPSDVGTPVARTPVAGSPLAGTSVAGTPPAGTPLAGTPALSLRAEEEPLLAEHAAGTARPASRSDLRPPLLRLQRATKAAALPVRKQDMGGAVTTTVPPASPRDIALSLLPSYGWDSSQFSCLDALWVRESDWDPAATNSSSGAYGIPQALPASKMAAFGSDWSTNPTTQITWGLWYIRQSYYSPCGAWAFWQSHNWY